jgi:dipeptidyl-peptidase 4
VTTSVTAADYARAERFLSWNQDDYVRNAELHYRWLEDGYRLWYRRQTIDGESEFMLVDARTGTVSVAFDHSVVAAALSRELKETVRAAALPFSEFSFTEYPTAIEFKCHGSVWSCDLERGTCVSRIGPAPPEGSMSPDGAWIAFVKHRNVWVRSTTTGEEIRLTADGAEHNGYAGSPGYSTHAVTDVRLNGPSDPRVLWSADSRFLLTHRIDERLVKDLYLIQSAPEDGSVRPRLFSYRYALPGDEHLPLLYPVALDVTHRRALMLCESPLVCSVQSLIDKRDTWWSSDSRCIYFLERDRFSRSVSLHRVDPLTGKGAVLIVESASSVVQTNARNIFTPPLVRTTSRGDILWYSQRDGWGHLYRYSVDGTFKNRITTGEWVVRDILRVDEARETIFFAASGREAGRDPYEQRIYSIRFDGSALRLLTSEEANHEWSNPFSGAAEEDGSQSSGRGRFSPCGKYFLDSYSRPDVPPVHVLRSVEGYVLRELETADISKLQAGGYTPVEPFEVVAADGKTQIYGNLYRPSNFDPRRKYPIIDAIYPGPQIIRTAKTFTGAVFGSMILDAQCLAELGFIVVTIDGRGTPYRSRDFLDYSYGRLDRASEIDDHIAGIRQLARRHPYIDVDRVGIDGASGGGFAAARALMAYPDFYKVAVAAAGNHDQRGNLAPWAETYIGPFDEAQYAASSTLPLVHWLRGKLLLMHGEMDDNVHPSLTMKLADALIRANKDFDLLIIPNADHSAYSTSPYFIRRKWDFFVRHLLGQDPPSGYEIRSTAASSPSRV